jgi:hypothetical protein
MPDPTGSSTEETLVSAMARLRAAGFTSDYAATETGMLSCSECGVEIDPVSMQIDEVVRFEGDSNPDDEAILIAVSCSCGCPGLYATGYGPSAARPDALVLRALAGRPLN